MGRKTFESEKSLLGIRRQKQLKKLAILTRKPQNRVRILKYRMWPIELELHIARNGGSCGGISLKRD